MWCIIKYLSRLSPPKNNTVLWINTEIFVFCERKCLDHVNLRSKKCFSKCTYCIKKPTWLTKIPLIRYIYLVHLILYVLNIFSKTTYLILGILIATRHHKSAMYKNSWDVTICRELLDSLRHRTQKSPKTSQWIMHWKNPLGSWHRHRIHTEIMFHLNSIW